MTSLSNPFQLGDLTLSNRIVMAPMTRCRAGAGDVPTASMLTYYQQRASAGLIITEATNVSPTSVPFEKAPGIYSDEQAAGWRPVVDAVHAAGGRIFCQLWHGGRVGAQRRLVLRRRRRLHRLRTPEESIGEGPMKRRTVLTALSAVAAAGPVPWRIFRTA